MREGVVRLRLVAGVAVASAMLAACGSSGGAFPRGAVASDGIFYGGTDGSGGPVAPTTDNPGSLDPSVAWGPQPRQIVLLMHGSGSCPPQITSLKADGAHHVLVTEAAAQGTPNTVAGQTVYACTADLRAYPIPAELPASIDISHPITIDVIDTDAHRTTTLSLAPR